MPYVAWGLTRDGGSETDAAFARKPLDVDDPLQGDGVAAVLSLQRQGSLPGPRPDVRGAERLLERVGARRRHERTHDLPAVEGDLDPDPLRASQPKPPPRERRERNPGARTRPRARRALRAATRRSDPRPRPRARRASRSGRGPRRRRGASPGRAWPGSARRACPRRAVRAARPAPLRSAATPPGRPGRPRSPRARSPPRTAARRWRAPRRGRRRLLPDDESPALPPARGYPTTLDPRRHQSRSVSQREARLTRRRADASRPREAWPSRTEENSRRPSRSARAVLARVP